jgi:hypothetical protein
MNREEFKIDFDAQIAKTILLGVKTYNEIGQEFGVSHMYVIKIAKRHGLKRTVGKGSIAWKNKKKALVA